MCRVVAPTVCFLPAVLVLRGPSTGRASWYTTSMRSQGVLRGRWFSRALGKRVSWSSLNPIVPRSRSAL